MNGQQHVLGVTIDPEVFAEDDKEMLEDLIVAANISGKIHSFDGSHLVIRFMKNFALQRQQAAEPTNIKFLMSMLKKYFGKDIEVTCITEGEKVATAVPDNTPEQVERVSGVSDEKRPLVKQIIKEFDGEIIRYNS